MALLLQNLDDVKTYFIFIMNKYNKKSLDFNFCRDPKMQELMDVVAEKQSFNHTFHRKVNPGIFSFSISLNKLLTL